MTLDDPTLLAFHADALEPGDAADVRAALAADPSLAQRLAALAAALVPAAEPPAFSIPPPGLGFAGFGLQGTAGVVMSGDDSLAPGDRFRVTLDPHGQPDARRVVVLYRSAQWDVVFPTCPDEDVAVAVLPTDDQGRHVLDLAARPEPGRQRWAVALPERGTRIDWRAPVPERWANLRRGLRRGRVPVASVDVTVRA